MSITRKKYSNGKKKREYGYIANLTTGGVSGYVEGIENQINFNEVTLTIDEDDELIVLIPIGIGLLLII